jgi:hypothetical protein
MSVYVVDASVAAKWFAEEEHSEIALSILAEQHELHAPDFLMLEIDNVLCTWIRRGTISQPAASMARSALAATPIHDHPCRDLRDDAYSLAMQMSRSVYDCLYVALALHLGAHMVTADRRLYDAIAAGPFGGYIVWIEDVE